MIKGLNSFRFFAFLSVFLFHVGLFEFGYMGVHAFFVLSGFLLTPIIIDMKEQLSVKDYFINFYGRRSLRIFPLYFLYLLIASILVYISLNIYQYDVNDRLLRAQEQMVYAATYTYNFFVMTSSYQQTQVLTHFWSLAVEEQFYLLWPLLIFLLKKSSIKKTLLLIIISGPIIRFLLGLLVSLNTNGTFNSIELTVYSFTLSSFDAFAIGGYFALYGMSLANWKILSSFIILVVLGISMQYFSGHKIEISSLGYEGFMKNGYKYVWAFSLFSILFAQILVNIRDKKFLAFIFELDFFAYLGKISYGLYVYHFPIAYFLNHELAHIPFYFRIPFILIITILLASASFHLFEKKFLSLKDRYFPHK